mgnify:FL=1|jgi:MoaA/NifB/PqqE/SkfB family radical SAM enzyme
MPINKNTFCVAPWYGLFVAANGKIAPCCEFQTQEHRYDQIEEYFVSKNLKKVRQDLLSGVKNANCDTCWKAEENKGDSLRLINNRTIAAATESSIMDQIHNPRLENIKSFDLTLGNLCNLKCVMCYPGLSSQLLAEVKTNDSLKSRYNKEYSQKDFDWPKTDDFVDWCNKYLPQSIHIKFTGGEPFIIPWIQTVLDKIPDQQKKKCVLHFTTNLTVVNLGLFENFRKFKEVWLSVSVEGIKDTHEYLRFGHKWETLETNLKLIQEMNIPNLLLKINHVVQTASYHSIIPMTNYFDNMNLKIRPLLLKKPFYHHIAALSKEAKQSFMDETKEYNGENVDFIKYVRSVSKQYMEQNTALTKLCIQDLEKLDRVRNNNYKDIIPETNLRLY